MKTAVVLRHVPFEDLGTLADVLYARGYQYRYIDTPVQTLAGLDAQEDDLLIVLGGPPGVYEEHLYPFLTEEIALIRQRLAQQRPVLGICLGAQLMARTLEAQVAFSGIKEIGYFPLTLTPEGEDSVLAPLAGVSVLHWHGDRFEIPSDAAHLAGSALCDNQAFAVGTYALALQFHPEVSARGLEGWLVGHASELAQAGIDPRTLREQAAAHSDTLADAAHKMMNAWLDRLPR